MSLDLSNLGEKELTVYRRIKVGFVFQDYGLIPNLSALENVMLPMEFNNIPAHDRKKRAIELLEEVKLGHRPHHRPKALSGGEQQRVAIARALANDPAIILADEPTGNLDQATGKEIVRLMSELAHEKAKLVIVATHDEQIVGIADTRFVIRDGKID